MNSNFFNLSKRQKRDLLSELLVGTTTEGIISKKELNALNNIIQSTPKNKRSPKSSSRLGITRIPTDRKKQKKAKRKITSYVSEETFNNLNTAQANIQSLLPDELQSSISKSHIMEQALALMLEELDAEGKNSRLLRKILRNT